MTWNPQLDARSDVPLYRQLYESLVLGIKMGSFRNNDKLPPTRELALQLGLNRTTVSAAYALLEQDGLIRGEVGRGSFVQFDRNSALEDAPVPDGPVSFASSRPAQDQFPVHEFQDVAREVIESAEAAGILQLGPPNGYTPLRHYLLEQARGTGEAGPDDDVLITSGCQQALDLLQRVNAGPGSAVAVEDPVYHGLKNVFERGGARLIGVPMRADGIQAADVGAVLSRDHPAMLMLTPNFQNPTGLTMSRKAREETMELARNSRTLLIENDIYGDLRYRGEHVPTIKSLDPNAGTLLLRSFSKVAFPGLRVGWMIGPRPVLARLAEAKQWCDLHSDQLSQAILLRFAQSGRLERHLERVRVTGLQRLEAVLKACEKHLPQGSTFTRPDGGMSLWAKLPEGLDTSELLPRAQREGVSYLPGRQFAIGRAEPGSLRISFGALAPSQIERGLLLLGKIFREELDRLRRDFVLDTAPALV